jgi:RNA polymerase sigma factor (sigma-70 family)
MQQKPPDQSQGDLIASPEEAISAWKAMSDDEKIAIRVFAVQQHRQYRFRDNVNTAEDLVSEAMLGILEGRRHWPRAKVGFASYLMAVINSIAKDWIRTTKGQWDAKLLHDSDLRASDERDEKGSLLDNAVENIDGPEELLIAQQTALTIQKEFENDEQAWLVLECAGEGKSGPQIQEYLGLSAKEFDAIRKRITAHHRKILMSN